MAINADLGHGDLSAGGSGDRDSVDGAGGAAGIASGAFIEIDFVELIGSHFDGVRGALLGAPGAPDAVILDDVFDEGFALTGGAASLEMFFILVSEISQGGEDGVGRGLSQSTDAAFFDLCGEFFEFFEISGAALSLAESFEDPEEDFGADSAEGALAAGFGLSELEEVSGDIDHAIGVVEDDHSAGAHDCAGLGEGFEIDGEVGQFGGDASAGGSADLDGLEFSAVGDASADFFDDLSDGDAHGDFDESAACDFSGKGEDFGAFAFFGSDGGEGLGAVADDPRDHGVGFDVVDAGRFSPESALCGERWSDSGHAAFSLDGGEQGGFLAADEGTRAFDDAEVQRELAAEDILAEESAFAAIGDGGPDAFDGEGILCADIEHAFVGADGLGGDDHSFEYAIGEGFEDHAIHEGAGVAFVAVADDIFEAAGGIAGQFPFLAGGETGAASAAEAGMFDEFDEVEIGLIDDRLFRGGEAVVA